MVRVMSLIGWHEVRVVPHLSDAERGDRSGGAPSCKRLLLSLKLRRAS